MSKNKRALVVDDDEAIALMVKLQLRKLGVSADVAASGAQALDLFKDKNYDIVFLDIQMPEMDGFEATRELRAIEKQVPKGRSTIVAMTASLDEVRARASGMDDFLFKPFRLDNLKQIVDKWVA